MSLRLRLSLLYMSLLGGALLLFGVLVYRGVSNRLLDQMDARLALSANQLVARLQINAENQFETRGISGFQPAENIIFQIWDNQQNLQYSRPPGLIEPLDEAALASNQMVHATQTIQDTQVRVLSVPLKTSREAVGVLQVGLSIGIIAVVQRTLVIVLIILTLAALVIAGLAAWLLTGRALAPLAAMTEVATHITEADDLSRRIPLSGSRKDEVSQLVLAFNQTLARLEGLFTAQRRFLADVSHELRTPLTVIKGEVGLMRLTGKVDRESLLNMETEADRLTRLVGDLLLLAQAESGRLPLEMSVFDLDEVLLEVFEQMDRLSAGRLELQIEEMDRVRVSGDRDRLKQVILNLVANAVQYTPAHGRVTMALSQAAGYGIFRVCDTGAGIPAVDLPHIFERFYRAEPSRARKMGSGFGLGLSIANTIVQRHNGRIEVQSEEGKGTTFQVFLPLAEESK